jgi:hypothetical protein
MSNIFDLADTWNNGAVDFTAIKMNVTDTSSGVASLLIDLQVGGASRFRVTKALAAIANTVSAGSSFAVNTVFNSILWNGAVFGWASSASVTTASNNHDLALNRDAADILAQRRSTNAQTHRVYGTFTDASNHRRVQLAMSTAGVATLRAEGAGTGATGNVLHISSLPTTNPGPGILWNNAGVPAIGT